MVEDLAQRIARLEARDELASAERTAILIKLEAIHKDLSRYRGFVGGVLFICSALVAAVSMAKGWLIGRI